MNRVRIDEDRLRDIFTEAADEGLRLAWEGLIASHENGTRLWLAPAGPDQAIALVHNRLMAKALESLPEDTVDRAEPAIYWSLQEVLEWMVYGRSDVAQMNDAPPITWSPSRAWRADAVVERRLDLLRSELAEFGVDVVSASRVED